MSRAHHEPGISDVAASGVPAQAREPGGAIPSPSAERGRSAGPEQAARVLIAGGCLLGLGSVALHMARTAVALPAVWGTAFLIGVAVLAFGYWLLRRIRPVRAPRTAVSLTAVAWGLFAAIGLALVANVALDGILATTLGPQTADVWGAAVSGPVDEELLKLAGIVLIAVAFPHALRGPMDGFVVGALVGLGFQVMENLFMAVQEVTGHGGLGGVDVVVQSAATRVLVTGLGTHWALSAVTGTAVGLIAAAGWRPRARTASAALLLVVLALGMHASINIPVLQDTAGAAFKALVNFAIVMTLYFALRRVYLRRFRDALGDAAEDSGMGRDSALALATRRRRRRALRAAPAADRAGLGEEQNRLVGEAESRAFERGARPRG